MTLLQTNQSTYKYLLKKLFGNILMLYRYLIVSLLTYISLCYNPFCLQRLAPQFVRVLTWTHWCRTKSVRPCRSRPLNTVTLPDRSNTAVSVAQSSATVRVQQPSPCLWQLSPLSPHTCIISNNNVDN